MTAQYDAFVASINNAAAIHIDTIGISFIKGRCPFHMQGAKDRCCKHLVSKLEVLNLGSEETDFQIYIVIYITDLNNVEKAWQFIPLRTCRIECKV